MKKNFIRLCLMLPALCLLAACGGTVGEVQTQQPASLAAAPAAGAAAPSEAAAESAASSAISSAAPSAQNETLVVYFSGTGNTKAVAETLSAALGCQSLEIKPAEPYTAEDLNYRDDSCRANLEMNDAAARPAIASVLSAVEDCSVIYLGYPIWWGTAPRIVNTFLESYDLSGATIYLFCTSGGSSVSRSVSDLKAAYPELNFADGRRFNASSSQADILEWTSNN